MPVNSVDDSLEKARALHLSYLSSLPATQSLVALEEISASPVAHHAAVPNYKVLLRLAPLKDHTVGDVARVSAPVDLVVGLNREFHLVLAAGEGESFGVAKLMGVFSYDYQT